MAVGGMLYTISDVHDLAEWMREKLDAHPLFERWVVVLWSRCHALRRACSVGPVRLVRDMPMQKATACLSRQPPELWPVSDTGTKAE